MLILFLLLSESVAANPPMKEPANSTEFVLADEAAMKAFLTLKERFAEKKIEETCKGYRSKIRCFSEKAKELPASYSDTSQILQFQENLTLFNRAKATRKEGKASASLLHEIQDFGFWVKDQIAEMNAVPKRYFVKILDSKEAEKQYDGVVKRSPAESDHLRMEKALVQHLRLQVSSKYRSTALGVAENLTSVLGEKCQELAQKKKADLTECQSMKEGLAAEVKKARENEKRLFVETKIGEVSETPASP